MDPFKGKSDFLFRASEIFRIHGRVNNLKFGRKTITITLDFQLHEEYEQDLIEMGWRKYDTGHEWIYTR